MPRCPSRKPTAFLALLSLCIASCSTPSLLRSSAERDLDQACRVNQPVSNGHFEQGDSCKSGYWSLVRSAAAFEHNSLAILFEPNFRGEAHRENMRNLLWLWGDSQFAQVLERQPKPTRERVVSDINYAWENPGWHFFPETYSTALSR
jgi:hypothetical protein